MDAIGREDGGAGRVAPGAPTVSYGFMPPCRSQMKKGPERGEKKETGPHLYKFE